MNVGDASKQVISLYKQAEALNDLCQMDMRKYEPQYLLVLHELRDAIHAFEEPSAMLTLIRKLTDLKK